ncbi:glycosyltransferase family 4 protein [Henriciella sp. AS95]|uniref:glycosyltransferase family 4 protein n=1 Tax=Henriciella sp. AS95 TaxID=3135782 RepID=UPI00317DB24C
MPRRNIVHILDDTAMGGVMRALDNFSDPRLRVLGIHETADIRKGMPRARGAGDIAVIHFTANWRKLPMLANIRLRGGFDRIILIEHTYTEGFERFCVSNRTRFRAMLRQAYRLVDEVVAVSHEQARWIDEARLTPALKIEVIGQACDVQSLMDLPPVSRKEGPLMIGAFGRFHEQKGFDLLIKAMQRVSPSTARLRLAGDGPQKAALMEAASGLEHVEICEAFTSPKAFLESVDVVAIPSRWEAFGLVGAEARAAGRPIIAADIDGLRQQMADHGYAHRVSAVCDLRRAIEHAAADPFIQRRGFQARAHVAGEYDQMIGGWNRVLSDKVEALSA